MNNDDKLNRIIYWIGIAFITWCVLTAMSVKADEDPCQWEIDNAKSICRAMGRKSPECAMAIAKLELCRAVGDDPLEGLT